MVLSPEKIIETICPALSGSPSLQLYLGMAAQVTNRGFFGAVYEQALAYRAAHLFTMMDSDSEGGGAPVASMSEGGLSMSFAQAESGTDGAALGSTKYGRMLLGLIKGRPTMGVNQSGGFFRR